MRIIETKAYQFEELDLPTQEKVIEMNREINTMFEWWDFAYEHFKECHIRVNSFDIGRRQECRVSFLKEPQDSALQIIDSFGENTEIVACAREFIDERNKIIEKSDDDFFEEEKILVCRFKSDIEYAVLHYLREEYEWIVSDEAVEETLVLNGYEFTIDGLRI